MNKLSVILGLFMVLLMVPIVAAQEQDGVCVKGCKLFIDEVDVKVDGDSHKDLNNEETSDDEAKPGSKIVVNLRVYNNFTNTENVDIEDIVVTLESEDTDFLDIDIDEDAKDLDAEDDDKVSFEFEIPYEVDEEDYEFTITANGDTKNNGSQEAKFTFFIEVKKDDHEVIFTKNSLTPSEIKCGRTVRLTSTVMNLGEDDEDGVTLEIINAELGVSFTDTFDLSSDPDDDNYDVTKTYTFSVPDDVAPGIYAINSKATFDDGGDTETDTVDLVVAQCEVFAQKEAAEEGKDAEEDTGVVVIQPPVTETPKTGMVTAGTVSAPTLPATEEKSFFGSSGFLVALVAGEVLLVIIAILLVTAVMRKRKE